MNKAMAEKNVFECSAVTKWVEIELTSLCGFKCIICPREKLEAYHSMIFEDFKKVVALVAEGNYTEIMVCGLGDSFLHKQMGEFFEYLFEQLPDIKLFIMTKGQAIQDVHLEKLKSLQGRGYNVSLTFSVFSLNKQVYNYLTGGDYYDTFMSALKRVVALKLNYSLEFLISTLTVSELDGFKEFAKRIGKDDYGVSLVHNWSGEISSKIHKKLFDEGKLKNYYTKRSRDDICEVMKYDYLYIDAHGDVFQCSLNEISRKGFLGKLGDYSLAEFLERKKALDYEKVCEGCFYLDYKTFG